MSILFFFHEYLSTVKTSKNPPHKRIYFSLWVLTNKDKGKLIFQLKKKDDKTHFHQMRGNLLTRPVKQGILAISKQYNKCLFGQGYFQTKDIPERMQKGVFGFMKKQLSILMLCLALSSPAFAITCKEGTVIQGKDGREFCSSKIKMNWWSAITWCESQKLSLSSIDACSDFGESYEITGRCHNFISGLDYSTYFWTATSTNKSEALSFRRPDGYTYSAKKGSTAAYALCD